MATNTNIDVGKDDEDEELGESAVVGDKIDKCTKQESQTLLGKALANLESKCKCLAWFIIVISAMFHVYRLFNHEQGGETCPLLFKSGHWLGNKWQPDGCMMHEYTSSETKTCLQNQRIALIGDSRMRALYYTLADIVSHEPVPNGKSHEDLKYVDKSNTTIEFYWIPFLGPKMDQLLRKWVEAPKTVPHLLLMGVGTWTIKLGKPTSIVDYQEQLKALSATMREISVNLTHYKDKHYNPRVSRFHHEPQLIWMLQDPVVESKLGPTRKNINNEKINMYNYAAQVSLSKSTSVNIMKATTMMAEGKPEESKDGLHYSRFILKVKVDAILNAFCNDYVYPDDASCCKDLERVTPLQFNAFAVLGTCVIMWLLMWVSRRLKERYVRGFTAEEVRRYEETSSLPWLYTDQMYVGMQAMAKMGAIVLYIFLADSSLLYNKEHKRYSHAAFFVPLVVMLAVGLSTRSFTKKTTLLNSDQVQEWKGWMIIVIMLYNYTQADKVLPVYVNFRLLISAFLFICGFQHFTRFWYSGDFGLYKVCKVIAHLNIFCVILCLVMGHSYQFYYIVPLLTFWFFVVYLTLALFPRINHNTVADNPMKNIWMVIKLGILFIFVFVVWGNENICEWLFSLKVVRELFIDGNGTVEEWRFISGLNRYSVLFGMLCGFTYVTLKKYDVIKDDDNSGRLMPHHKYSFIALLLGCICIVGYEIQAFTCHSKDLCNHTHTLASCIPILGYVLLRNVPGFIRCKYSTFFAWVGGMAIELYIAQYHIWLANDNHGLHVLIPGYPTINALVTTFTFVNIVHEIKTQCNVLAEQLVTKDIRVMLRRLLIFVIMLVIIWWHKTHEKKPSLY